LNYFFWAPEEAGPSVCCVAGACVSETPSMMEEPPPFPKRKARPREVSIKIIAAAAVTLCKNEVAPALPKTVWLEPPNAAPILAPLPL